MKKIVSLLLCLLIISSSFIQTFANSYYSENIITQKKSALKNIITTKNELQKISNWSKYITAMDNIANKIKSSSEKIEEMQNKIYTAISPLESKQWNWTELTSKETKILIILNYLDARLYFMQLDIMQTEADAEESQLAEVLEAVKNPSISDSDKEKLEKAFIVIQKNVLEKTKQNTYEILWDFEEYLNYENNGDFEMDLNIDHESIWEIQAELKISDYIVQNANFDSRFKGHISAMVDALPKWEEAMKAEFNSFFDFISKDGQIYALAEDLEIITDENIDIIQDILDNLEILAKENKYIEISDEESVAAMNFIQSLHPDTFFSDAEELFSQSMFTAYKKDAEVYSLIPTKYACDTMKDLMNKFDPFSPNVCTDSQYQDLIEDIVSIWELTMTLGKENVLKYTVNTDEEIDKLEMSVAFTDSSIEKINIDVFPNQINYPNEKLVLTYEKNKDLDFELYADQWEINIIFAASLDSKNNISKLIHTWYIEWWSDTQEWNIDISNRKISWEYTLETQQESYNYETWEYEEENPEIFQIDLTWNTNSNNELNNINVIYTANDGEVDYLNWEVIYNLPQLKIYNNYSDNYWEAVFDFDGNWNTRNSNFDEFELSAEAMKKSATFNYDTYTYEYSDEKEKIFDLNYSLNNSDIQWELNIYENEEVTFWIVTDGNYKKDILELNNKITADFMNTFYGQIDKARDTMRISDIMSLKSALEQSYYDYSEYPNQENFEERVSEYLWSVPSDPSGTIEMNDCKFGYYYEVWKDDNWIENQAYNISTCFESLDNISRAEYDNGKYDKRYEVWAYINQDMDESFYIQWFTSWEKTEAEIHSVPVVNLNFGYDYTSNNANSELYIDAIFEDEKVFEMNIKNTGTIEYKNVEINTPRNSVPLENIFETNSYNY